MIGCISCLVIVLILWLSYVRLARKALSESGWGAVINGSMTAQKTMPDFLKKIKVHDYRGASELVDPASRTKLTAAKIQSIVEQVESKLGPLVSVSPSPQMSKDDTLGYTYRLTYARGSADATFVFQPTLSRPDKPDAANVEMSGLITDFMITPQSP